MQTRPNEIKINLIPIAKTSGGIKNYGGDNVGLSYGMQDVMFKHSITQSKGG